MLPHRSGIKAEYGNRARGKNRHPQLKKTMKTTTGRNKNGSVLVTTIIVMAVLTVMISGYLFLLQGENNFVSRDQKWNGALALAEGGVEEAMAHINSQGVTSLPPPYGADGWSASGTSYHLPGGAPRTSLYGGSYNLVVLGGNSSATISSTGMINTAVSGAAISRTVQVIATRTSAFQVAIAALQGVTMNGGGSGKLVVDSYDSSDTNKFPGGLYLKKNRQNHGDVATLQPSGTWFSLGNANIMGKLHSGPGGTVQQAEAGLGPNGSVGEVSFVTGGFTGIENPKTDWFADDMNMLFPDVKPPYSSGASVSVPAANKTNTLSSGQYYYSGKFSIPNKATLEVAPYSFVVLYVTGGFDMGSQSKINVPLGSQLIIYVGGTSGAPTSSSFTTINNGGNANSFQYFGLPNNTSLTWGGNDSYIGTVYAPEAAFTLNGGGSTDTDYQGACIVKSVTMNGHFSVHYDENLARSTNATIFVPTSWAELGVK
jgi:hypothetical protein